jgi:hypothetical protein
VIPSASVARGRDARDRLLVLLAVIPILVSLLIAGAANPRPVLGAPGSNTVTFGVAISGSVTAGTPFTVTVTAQDARGRTVNSYPGGASLSGLANSPSGASATYGTISNWNNGVGSTTVTAKKSQTGARVTASGIIDGVTVSGQSAAFSVAPSTAASISFADTGNGFNGQPVDAKFDTPIGSSLGTSFVPVKVIALDTFGNRVAGVSVTMTAPSQLDGTKTATTSNSGSFGTSPYGEASFSTLSITEFNHYTLTATAGVLTADSATFEIVADLAKCSASSCKNTGRSAGSNLQITYSSLTGQTTLSGLTLTTSFIGDATTAGCAGSGDSIGELSEVRVQGEGVTTAKPSFQLAVILPKLTLQNLALTSRAVDTYNICLGATRLEAGGGWVGRQTLGGPLVTLTPDSNGVYWGWAADCGTPGLTSDSPCISLKTKNAGQLQAELGMTKNEVKALPFESSDLALVIRKPYPWDAKVGVH